MNGIRRSPQILVLIWLASSAAGAQSDCGRPADTQAGKPWKSDQAFVFETQRLAVDADGAPNSYLVDGNGLSDTCDGVLAIINGQRVTPASDPAHWLALCRKAWADAVASGDYSGVAIFGMLTDKQHRPIVQQAGDPLPGKGYISTTSMSIAHTPDGTQRHWVDAVQVPYVVLPSSFTSTNHVRTGDLAAVYRPKTGAVAYGVFADEGGFGEASVRLHRDLGNEPITNPRPPAAPRARRGIDEPMITVVFPGVNVPGMPDAEAWHAAIQSAGKTALEHWGGVERLKTCANDVGGR